jgi:hypothetical protein
MSARSPSSARRPPRARGWIAALSLGLAAGPAQAADWLRILGEEAPGADAKPRATGFLEAVGEAVVGGGSAQGLPAELGDLEGELPSFNRVGPGDATWGFSVKRARFGLRGVVPGAKDIVSYAISAEFGDNQLTRTAPVVLTDAATNLRLAPFAQLRLGQFKLPTAEEAIESNPQAAHFVNFSTGLAALMLESPVEGGAYTGGGSGLRDVGAMAWGHHDLGGGGLGYALMLSNGRMGGLDVDDNKDLTGRVSATLWGQGERRDPRRDELVAFAWWQEGSRLVAPALTAAAADAAPQRHDRRRRGAGLSLQRQGLHLRSELIDAQGVIDAGFRLPFPGQEVVILGEGQARASNTFAHYTRPVGDGFHLGGGLRYDRMRRWTEAAADERVFSTWTANGTVGIGEKVHLLVDYERRSVRAPEGAAATTRLLDTMGDRVSGELVVNF